MEQYSNQEMPPTITRGFYLRVETKKLYQSATSEQVENTKVKA